MDFPNKYNYFVFSKNPFDNKYLNCFYENGNEKEVIYIHLQKRKMNKLFDSYNNIFYIKRFSFDLSN